LENAVERDVDVIILSMTDLRASKAAIESANKAGIPIFTVDSGWTEGVVVDVTSNNYVMSGKVSSYLADRLGGKGNIVAFKENTHHGVRKRGEILDVVVKENPGIKVVAEHNIDPTNFFEDTRQAMEDFLTRYGTDIDAVWAGWDEPAQAAADAIKAAGYTREDMFVVGIDGHPSAIDEIRSGSPFVATVAQAFEQMGSLTAEYVQQIVVEGRPVNEVIPSTTVYLESPLITPENLPEKGELPWKAPDFYESGS
jgi:ABC-type sugar transport system substrate-binding protein